MVVGLLAAYHRGQYWPLKGPLGGLSTSVGSSAILAAARLTAAPVAAVVT